MDEIVKQVGRKNNCTFCGVFRRQALDRGAALLKCDVVVTGHNADDVAETVLMNLLRGDVARLQRCTSHITVCFRLGWCWSSWFKIILILTRVLKVHFHELNHSNMPMKRKLYSMLISRNLIILLLSAFMPQMPTEVMQEHLSKIWKPWGLQQLLTLYMLVKCLFKRFLYNPIPTLLFDYRWAVSSQRWCETSNTRHMHLMWIRFE